MTSAVLGSILLLLAAVGSGCGPWGVYPYALGIYPLQPLWYRADPITAGVVDATTGEPVEGVIAVAHWQLVNAPGSPVGQLAVMETVTDAAGVFAFPGWGPRRRPIVGVLDVHDPEVILFKPGYEYTLLNNYRRVPEDYRRVRREVVWNGTTVRLRRCDDPEVRCEERLGLSDFGHAFPFNKQCDWKRMQRLLCALLMERTKSGRGPAHGGGPPSLDSMEGRNQPYIARCGGVGKALGECDG